MAIGEWVILSFRGWDAQSEAQRVTVQAMQVVMIAGSWGARGWLWPAPKTARRSLLSD